MSPHSPLQLRVFVFVMFKISVNRKCLDLLIYLPTVPQLEAHKSEFCKQNVQLTVLRLTVMSILFIKSVVVLLYFRHVLKFVLIDGLKRLCVCRKQLYLTWL